MKAIQMIVLAIFAALGLSSCQVTSGPPQQGMYGPPMQYGPPQQMAYGQQQVGYGHQESGFNSYQPGPTGQPYGGQQRQWFKEERVQNWLTPEGQGVRITVDGDAPSPVLTEVRVALVNWCVKVYEKHGVWPTRQEAAAQAQVELRSRGFNLVPTTQRGASGGFMLSEYSVDKKVNKGPRQKNGPEMVKPRQNIATSDVPESILKRSRSAGRDNTEPFSGGERTIRFIGADSSSPSFEQWKKTRGQ